MRGAVCEKRQGFVRTGWRRLLAPMILAVVLALVGGQFVGVSEATVTVAGAGGCGRVSGSAPGADDLPGVDAMVSASDLPRPIDYTYENPAEGLKGIAEPTRRDLNGVGDDPSAHDAGSKERAYAAWNRYLERKRTELLRYRADHRGKKPSTRLPWDKWLRNYVPNQGNDARGKAFEKLVAQRAGNREWKCQEEIDGATAQRIYDAVDHRKRIAYEFKSGAKIDEKQLAKDKEAAMQNGGYKIVYVFGKKPSAATLKLLADANIVGRVLAAVGLPKEAEGGPGSQRRDPDTDPLRGPGQGPSSGAAADALAAAADTPLQVAELAKVDAENAADSGAADESADLGGIDFSTLELRYVADTDAIDGSGLQYAFQARATADGQLSFGGLKAAQQASDAFFVWLALSPSSFTVNLSPDEPNRIVDAQLGRTDAGRVLLEADLQMKKTTASLIHPNTVRGLRYWNSLRGAADGSSCLSFRVWIVPTPATVRENKGELHILDAPLAVKMESEYAKGLGRADPSGGGCRAPNRATQQHNEAGFRSMILPNITHAVNKAPEYAELRRVYLSRVAAQWMRERSEKKTTAYSDIIDSGNIDRWVSRQPWSPREVFNRFVKSYTDGEFNVTRKTRSGNIVTTTTYVYGGVDFTGVPRVRLDSGAFRKQWSGLPATVDRSRRTASPDQDGRVWLGGEVPADPQSRRAVTRRLLRSGIHTLVITAGVSLVSTVVTLMFVPYLIRRRRPRYRPVPPALHDGWR